MSFLGDVSSRQSASFTVERGSPAVPPQAVSVRTDDTSVHIDTGAIRFSISQREFAILESLSIEGKPVEREPVQLFMEVGGHRALARAPDSVVVEERGPVRAQVLLRGNYENGFAYEIRLQAFAGKPFIRVFHTFINTTDPDYTNVDRIGLEVPLDLGAGATYTAAVEGGAPIEAALPVSGARFEQPDNLSYQVDGTTRQGHLSGWFEAVGKKASVGLDVPFFWQEYPQAVRLTPTGLVYDLWSSSGGPAKVGVGAAKTHEFMLAFGGRGKPSDMPQLPDRGPIAHVDARWVLESHALAGEMGPPLRGKVLEDMEAAFARYARSVKKGRWDDSGQVQCPPPERERPRTGFYGMFNWGDWNFPRYHDDTKGCDAWGNLMYDLPQVLGMLFISTGRADVFEHLVASARHFADVDRIHHFPRSPGWVGMNHPKNPLHFTFELGGVDLGHTWVEGLFTYYFLTGEERSMQAATGIATYLIRDLFRGNPRQFGWPALALSVAADATGDRNYENAALEYAMRAIKAYPGTKALKTWKMGVLADALCYVHARGGNLKVWDWLQQYSSTVAEKKPKDIRYYPAVAYVARVTGDPKLRKLAEATAGSIAFGSWGKPFTIGARTAFRIRALLEP